jgi:hypothetical protein
VATSPGGGPRARGTTAPVRERGSGGPECGIPSEGAVQQRSPKRLPPAAAPFPMARPSDDGSPADRSHTPGHGEASSAPPPTLLSVWRARRSGAAGREERPPSCWPSGACVRGARQAVGCHEGAAKSGISPVTTPRPMCNRGRRCQV